MELGKGRERSGVKEWRKVEGSVMELREGERKKEE